MDNTQPKRAYEWILIMSKGDDVILSENQYDFYKKNYKEAKVFFADKEVNPAFVVQVYKRPAQYIKEKYPCRECYQSGRKPDNTGWCDNCGGSGVDIPKV